MTMKNEYKQKIIDKVMKIQEEEAGTVKKEVEEFCDNNMCEIVEATSDVFLNKIGEITKGNSYDPIFNQEQLEAKCKQIRTEVKQGKESSVEVNFVNGYQNFKGCKYELSDTVIKVFVMNEKAPIYLHLHKSDSVNCLVFLGGEEGQGILAIKRDDEKVTFVRVSEFHMLSISENSEPNREIGLMTSYLWITAKVSSSVVMGENLIPIKNLLCVDGLKNIQYDTKNRMEVKRDEQK